MAFGKRTAGQAPPPYTPPADEPEITVEAGVVRTRVTNPGAIDRKFIGIAAGVVILSAGAAIAAPSLMSIVSGHNVRPIEQVIAGLDRDGMRAALAQEAFPDEAGRAFMTSLATHFPNQHGRLLDKLADTAAAGGSRDALYNTANAWSMEFAPGQLQALSRTGAEGFDAMMDVVSDAMVVLEAEAGGCTLQHLQQYFVDPSAFLDLSTYGGKAYNMSMRASQSFVELAAKGRNAQPVATKLTPDDEIALRATFFSLIADPQVMDAVQAFGAPGGQAQNFGANNLNVCKLGKAVMVKFDGLPNPTKARLLVTALSGDNAAFFRDGGFNAFGAGFNAGANLQPGSFGGTQFFP